MIEPIHDSLNLAVGYVLKTATFGKVLKSFGHLYLLKVPSNRLSKREPASKTWFNARLIAAPNEVNGNFNIFRS